MKQLLSICMVVALGCSGASQNSPAPPSPEEPVAVASPTPAPAATPNATSKPSGETGETGGEAASAEPAYEYTSLGPEACKAGKPDRGMIVSRCSGFGGYELQITGHDHGSELDFVQGGKALGLEYESPGWMADVTTGKVEWRHRGGTPHALIFRVKWTDASSGDNVSKSTLLVARIDGSTACELGRTGSNDEARKIADDPGKTCG